MQTKHKDMNFLLRMHESKKKKIGERAKLYWQLALITDSDVQWECTGHAVLRQVLNSQFNHFFSILVTPKALLVDFLHLSSLDK